MLKYSKLGLAVSAIIAATAFSGLSLANASGPNASHANAETFTLLAPNDTVELQLGSDGATNGDTLVFHGPLFDQSGAHQVGVERGYCVFVDLAAGAAHCDSTETIGDSTIEYSGTFFSNADGSAKPTDTLAIVGGTGRYAGAGGTIRIENLNASGSNARLRFDLVN